MVYLANSHLASHASFIINKNVKVRLTVVLGEISKDVFSYDIYNLQFSNSTSLLVCCLFSAALLVETGALHGASPMLETGQIITQLICKRELF